MGDTSAGAAPALPDPLVPAEVDLTDFGFMPLDVRKLLSSSLWIKAKKDPRVAHAAVSLWCESWHQVPCGSLPDDDEVLADLARCDEKEWRRVRERALAHFTKCSDGRLYHQTVCAKALESWASKQAHRERTKAATAARLAKQKAKKEATDEQRDEQRDEERDEQRDVERHDEREQRRDVHQGTGTVKGQGYLPPTPKGSDESFASFWAAYPRKEARKDALKVFSKLKPDEDLLKSMLATLARQAESPQWRKDGGQFVPLPASWLNGRRWEDESGSDDAAGGQSDPMRGAI